MGYRSDVMAVFYTLPSTNPEYDQRNRATLQLFVQENFPEAWKKPEYALDGEGLTMLETESRLVFEFKISSVKWYESYPEVEAFNKFWDAFCDLADGEDEDARQGELNTTNWACEFVRLGENEDDIERLTSAEAEYLLDVVRTIEANY